MSDIFTNLVLRNGGTPSSAILQPRLPSLFESPNLVEGLTETISALKKNGTFLESPKKSSVMPSVESNYEPMSIPTPLDRSSIINSDHTQSLNPAGVLKDPINAHDELVPVASRSFPAATENSLNGESLLELDSRRAETITGRKQQMVGIKSLDDNQHTSESSLERVVHPYLESVSPLHREIQQLETRNPIAKSNLEKPAGSILPSEMESESPVVQIHIGRIEVRAITPAAAQAAVKAAPAQPRMTLDEYLRQREGRR